MLVIWMAQALFGLAALACSAMAARAVLRRDRRGHFYLMLTGAFALVFFLTLPTFPMEMIGISLLAIATGAVLAPTPERPATTLPRISLEDTATRRRR